MIKERMIWILGILVMSLGVWIALLYDRWPDPDPWARSLDSLEHKISARDDQIQILEDSISWMMQQDSIIALEYNRILEDYEAKADSINNYSADDIYGWICRRYGYLDTGYCQ